MHRPTIPILFVWSLFCSPLASAQQCDAPADPISSMQPSFGGIGAFYDIAKGISDGLQSTPNSKTYNDLNNLIFGNGAVTYGQVVKDMVVNQIGAIVFWSFGFVFILAALVLGIATCIWQCCYSCVPKEGSSRSSITGYVYAFLLFAFFSFVLTGIVLFNITETKLVNTINNGMQYTDEISNDLNNILLNGTGQITCEVQTTTNQTFDAANQLILSYATVVVNGTENDVGLTAVNDFNYNAYRNQNDVTVQSANDLNTALKGFQTNGQPESCTNGVSSLNDQYFQQVTGTLTALSEIALGVRTNPQLHDLNAQIESIQSQIQSQANQAASSITSAQKTIDDSVSSITSMLNNVQHDIDNVINSIKSGHRDLMASSAYSAIQITLRLVVTIPACIGCLFAIFAFVAIVLSLKKQDGLAVKLAPGVLAAFYTTIVISIALLAFSSIAFVGGWFMSAMCVPIFEDPDYHLFHLMNQTVYPVGGGSPDVVNIGGVLESCTNSDTTLYTAINGSVIISADSINQQLNLDKYRNQANQEIESQPTNNFPINPTWTASVTALNDSYSTATAANLAVCGDTTITDLYNSFMKNFKDSIDLTNSFYGNLQTLNSNAPNVSMFAEQQNNQQFDSGELMINQSISNLMTNLQTNVFKCSPLVDIYNNGGLVMCSTFGKPVQGLWASIGLSGIFMFFLSILLLLTFRWLKTDGKDVGFDSWDKSQTKSDGTRRLGNRNILADDDIFSKPTISSTSNTGRLPRVRPSELSEQPSAPYFSDTYSPDHYPRVLGVQVLPDSRHPPMSPNHFDTQEFGTRTPFDDVDLFGERYSNHGSTTRGLRRS